MKSRYTVPTIFTHAVAGATIARIIAPPAFRRKPLLVAAAITAMLPDADTVSFRLGISYDDLWGHRGISHSLAAAALAGGIALAFTPAVHRLRVFAAIALATASHGLLDMLTNGGRGVALFAPFENSRYFFPWTPIKVSPIGVHALFTQRFAAVLTSEFIWVWIPCIAILALIIENRTRAVRGA